MTLTSGLSSRKIFSFGGICHIVTPFLFLLDCRPLAVHRLPLHSPCRAGHIHHCWGRRHHGSAGRKPGYHSNHQRLQIRGTYQGPGRGVGEKVEYICQDLGGVDELSEKLALSGADLFYTRYIEVKFCFFDLILKSHQQSFSYIESDLPGLNQY